MSCGHSHSACVTDQGSLYVWGNGDGGRLGLGMNVSKVSEPTLVRSLLGEKIVQAKFFFYLPNV